MIEDILCCSLLHDSACVHDHDIVRHLRDHAKVVGDQHDGGVDAVLQVPQKIQDLCLDRNVQRRRGLICDDDPGAARKGHGDHDSLPHAAGQLMGIHAVYALAVCDPDHLQSLDRALLDLFFCLPLSVMKGDDLIHLISDPEDRIQGGHGLLEDHGDHIAADRLHLLLRDLGDLICFISEIQPDLSGYDLALRSLDQLHQGQARHGLAAAGLADHADRLADRDVEGHPVHTVDRPAVGEEEGMQIVELHCIARIVHGGQVL